eukprot:TRINITY_DN440_c0_g1_i1.p2 TRINITY_DN440_c0_g1~~TRINITY_DN440_c0_g1_i1.p2  ORF type:complete len:198 (+),score=29.10 TRINITY_DN440_c0_g1_i1:1570-2163(+)
MAVDTIHIIVNSCIQTFIHSSMWTSFIIPVRRCMCTFATVLQRHTRSPHGRFPCDAELAELTAFVEQSSLHTAQSMKTALTISVTDQMHGCLQVVGAKEMSTQGQRGLVYLRHVAADSSVKLPAYCDDNSLLLGTRAPVHMQVAGAKEINSGGVGLVFLCDVAPGFFVKLSAPYWFHLVPHSTRVIACGVLMVCAFR